MTKYNCETMTLSGQKLPKNDPLIELGGAADELNAHLGLVKSLISNEDTRKFIEEVQTNLMKLMSHASSPQSGDFFINDNELALLEKKISDVSPPPENYPDGFQLPGKNATEAQIHIARTVARRTERMFAAAVETRQLCPIFGSYLNKLSEYLFVLSLRVVGGCEDCFTEGGLQNAGR